MSTSNDVMQTVFRLINDLKRRLQNLLSPHIAARTEAFEQFLLRGNVAAASCFAIVMGAVFVPDSAKNADDIVCTKLRPNESMRHQSEEINRQQAIDPADALQIHRSHLEICLQMREPFLDDWLTLVCLQDLGLRASNPPNL
ncbi:MAG: hypothetical protein R3C05_14915 [Pirellulaceae bacterium]